MAVMVELALVLPPEPDERWHLAKQLGVDTAVVHSLEIGDGTQFWEYDQLLGMKNWFEEVGLDIGVIEGGIPLTDTTRLGLTGRDAEIEQFKQFLQNLGTLGVPVVCYDWMAGLRWARTDVHIEARGNSVVSGFNAAKMNSGPVPDAADFTSKELWSNLEYFLEEVIPVAEEAGVKLGFHPDDPPRETVRGVPRIINSVQAYDRLLGIYESEYNGITFCQGNFAAMGVNLPETIRHFGDRINFVHFRDVRGDADRFAETWHDDGPTDMTAAMRAYHRIGFDGPMRPDHVPTMAGESNSNPGYETNGRLFAIGYMRGLLDSVDSGSPQ